jgi:hypothetical protein
VKVYVVVPTVEVLIVDGFQVPLILLFDVVGNACAEDPWQNGPSCVNVGVAIPEMITSIVVVVPHCPADGVKM